MSENRTCLILFPMGKVKKKAYETDTEKLIAYQLPMGKVKIRKEKKKEINIVQKVSIPYGKGKVNMICKL